MDSPSATIWRRRVALTAGVGLLIAIPVTLLVRAGGDDSSPDAEGTSEVPAVHPAVEDRGLRVDYRVPDGWRQRKQPNAVRLVSNDGTTQVVIAAPAPASRSDSVLNDALATVRSGYRQAEIRRGHGREVGGLDAKGAVATARTPRGDPLRILIAVAEGERRTYLVEVFSAARAPAARLAEAQVALNSLKLNG